MRSFGVILPAMLSIIAETLCTPSVKGRERDSLLRFDFTQSMLVDFSYTMPGECRQAYQFVIPEHVDFNILCQRAYNSVIELHPKAMETFNQVFVPKIDALRNDVPKYFCQPLFGEDELRLMVDLFFDRVEGIIEQVRADFELAKNNAPFSSLARIIMYMALPPFKIANTSHLSHNPQELIQVAHEKTQYMQGRMLWKETLEKAQKYGTRYVGPIPAAMRQSVTACSQPCGANWSELPADILLHLFCMTGPYVWYARLVSKKWRSASSPFDISMVLGYAKAFKMLSGRMLDCQIVVRLSSLAQSALLEICSTKSVAPNDAAVNSSSEPTPAAGARKRTGAASGLQSIVRTIDPILALRWYNDAREKLPGLEDVIGAEIFELFLGTRDDGLALMLLLDALCCPGFRFDPQEAAQSVYYKILRAYLKKYPGAAGGHSLPTEDSQAAWGSFKGLERR